MEEGTVNVLAIFPYISVSSNFDMHCPVSALSTMRTVLQHSDMYVKHVVNVITPVLRCCAVLSGTAQQRSTTSQHLRCQKSSAVMCCVVRNCPTTQRHVTAPPMSEVQCCDVALCCQELPNNTAPRHSTSDVASPMLLVMFSFGVQVHSTGLLYVLPVSYCSMESGFNLLHCVGEHSAASK